MKKNVWSVGIMILITLLAFAADYGKMLLKVDASKNFNFTPGILYLLLANLMFAGLLYWAATSLRENGISPTLAILFLLIGSLLVLLQWVPTRAQIFPLPLQTLQVTYSNLTAVCWIAIGAVNLFRRARPDR